MVKNVSVIYAQIVSDNNSEIMTKIAQYLT